MKAAIRNRDKLRTRLEQRKLQRRIRRIRDGRSPTHMPRGRHDRRDWNA